MVLIVPIDTRAAGKIFGWPQLGWNWWSSGYFCYWSCHRPANFWEPLNCSTGALWKCFECNYWAEINHSDIKAASSAFGSLKLAQNALRMDHCWNFILCQFLQWSNFGGHYLCYTPTTLLLMFEFVLFFNHANPLLLAPFPFLCDSSRPLCSVSKYQVAGIQPFSNVFWFNTPLTLSCSNFWFAARFG